MWHQHGTHQGPHVGFMNFAIRENYLNIGRYQVHWTRPKVTLPESSSIIIMCSISTQIAKFMGPTWGHLGHVGPRWAPCWSHEPCYQGSLFWLHKLSTITWHEKELFQWQCTTVDISVPKRPRGRLNKKDGLTRYGDSHVKDKTS